MVGNGVGALDCPDEGDAEDLISDGTDDDSGGFINEGVADWSEILMVGLGEGFWVDGFGDGS